jgi:hypothetical protein
VRGECTLLIEGSADVPAAPEADDDARLPTEAGGSVRTIAAFLVTRHRLSRRAAYETAQRVMGG